ncbi:hypothetical protein FQZ97_826130 [compost metagenome]
MLHAGEDRVGETLFQARLVRPGADDHLAAGQVERQEGIQVLFPRDPPDAQEDRTGQAVEYRAGRARLELAGIDAPRPDLQVRQAAPHQDVAHRGRRHQHALRRPVEPAQVAPGQGRRNAHARLQIVGKHRVERGGEAPAPRQRHAARGQAQRAFGSDMQRIGHGIAQDAAQLPARLQAEAQIRLGWRRNRPAALGIHHDQLVPPFAEDLLHGRPGADDAIDLRMPGIRDQDDAHDGAGSGR